MRLRKLRDKILATNNTGRARHLLQCFGFKRLETSSDGRCRINLEDGYEIGAYDRDLIVSIRKVAGRVYRYLINGEAADD